MVALEVDRAVGLPQCREDLAKVLEPREPLGALVAERLALVDFAGAEMERRAPLGHLRQRHHRLGEPDGPQRTASDEIVKFRFGAEAIA